MPMYEFQSADGQLHERHYEMGKAPKIGKWIKAGGVRMRRLAPVTTDNSMRGIKCLDVAHEAVGMPNRRHGIDPAVPRYSKDGFPVFLNMREIREFQAKRPQYKWDTGRGYEGMKK